MWLSDEKNHAQVTFVPDGFDQGQPSGNGEKVAKNLQTFAFPLLAEVSVSPTANPLIRSYSGFLPTVFESALSSSYHDDRQNLENTRRRLLDQLEAYKKQQEEELYQLRLAAEQQAQDEREQGRQDAIAIRSEAEKKGFAEGLAAGEQQVLAQVSSLAEVGSRLAALEEILLRQHEQQLIELAVAIARNIVHQELTLDPETIVAIARRTIEEMPAHGPVTLKVHPDDYVVLHERLPALQREFDHLEHFQLVASETVERGGCLLETAVGQVDASLESQFSEIKASLRDGP